MNRFTEKAEKILAAALPLAEGLGHTYVGTEHLLLAILSEECAAEGLLESHGVYADRVRTAIVDTAGSGTPAPLSPADMTPRLRTLIERAAACAVRGGAPFIGSEHLLYAMTEETGSAACRLLAGMGVNISELRTDLSALLSLSAKEKEGAGKAKTALVGAPILTQYGVDLTAAAREGKIDPVIGRERETARLIQILSRRRKNNPCLVGEPGVGKTAVVEGLALRLAEGDVPSPLRGKVIISLDLGSMIAGAKYRGEFEERLKNALAEAVAHPEVVLFIDEIHSIVGAGAAEGAVDAANIMKPALSRGEIQVIGATTLAEYRRYIEKDAALERRFQPLAVEEPTEEETLAILQGLGPRYEAHHGLLLSEEAIRAAVTLSRRYLPDRFLPDKAIDLLDESAARLRVAADTMPAGLASLAKELAHTSEEKEACIRRQDFEGAARMRDRERALRAAYAEEQASWKERKAAPTVSPRDVAATLTLWTGIPTEELEAAEEDRLSRLEEALRARVVGQDEAISRLAAAVRRGRLGLRDPRRPIGSFLFLGPTGVGKTELCRALATALFGEKQALCRFDMSEYMEKHSVAKLIGAPPGYVGHEDGGLLTEAIRRRPYAVLLFDEIEKAHPDVLNLLLQVLEDGRLTDAQGRHTDFSSTVIIMTSNAVAGEGRRLGFGGNGQEEEPELRERLRGSFRPEFLNRIDDILLFHPLDEQAAAAIVRLLLAESEKRARAAGLRLTYDESAVAFLAARGYDKAYGARPLRRTVTKEIEDALSDLLLTGELRRGAGVHVSASENGLRFSA
ncbi:MAG: ATP-dependent Clp protease ATP-binding subunit, partial [Clostridia bacterium]|nr:ATP-dependent Clp protease ATP-binding subunit [Clostridia bacterium]